MMIGSRIHRLFSVPLWRSSKVMNKNWEILKKKTLFQGYFRIDRYTLQHDLFAGGTSEQIIREVFERGHAAAVLPYDPIRDEVVLIEQFRIGAMDATSNPWLIEVVAGIIEEGESEESVCLRESEEEAGCKITALEFISRYYASPGGTTETCALYCGQVDSEKAGGVFGLANEGEDIKASVVPADQAFAWIGQGTINSAAAIISLQWLQLNKEQLRQQWLEK